MSLRLKNLDYTDDFNLRQDLGYPRVFVIKIGAGNEIFRNIQNWYERMVPYLNGTGMAPKNLVDKEIIQIWFKSESIIITGCDLKTRCRSNVEKLLTRVRLRMS